MYFKFSLLLVISILVDTLNAQWTNRFSGQGDLSDVFHAIVLDDAGNAYAAGYTINTDVSKDILVAKFNSAGDTVWTRQFGGTGNGPDEALGMAIAPDGSIVITGYQKGAGTGFDFITQKYATNGDLIWTSIYNYSTNESDQSNAIAIDGSGNIYIAGQSDKDISPINDDDYVVVKYNASGVQQWAKRSDGTISSTDRPSAIAIGTDGNVIVTGRSDNGSDDDYLTIKYNSASGAESWRKTFDRTHHDRATDLAIDPASGKIFVTGRSNNGTNYDYATLCYSTSGALQWQAIFDYVDDDRATNIALDGSGNVYVAGQSDANAAAIGINYDFLLVKYSNAGTQQFVQSWDGTAGDDDIPAALIVDDAGNSTIVGYSDADGGTAVANDMAALRFNSTGVLQWSKTYSTAGANNVAEAAAVDGSGNVIAAGYNEVIPNRDAAVVKWNNAGTQQWSNAFNGVGDQTDNAHAIMRDGANNTIAVGYTTNFDQDRNFLIMKLSASGSIVWTRTFNGSSTKQSTDDALAVTVDGSNNIYAAGFLKNSGTGYDLLVVKLNTAGDSLWAYQYNDATSNETDKAIALHVNAAGEVTVCGRTDNDATVTSDDDILLIRLNASGILNWTARYQGTGSGDDIPRQMIVAPSGNIYVAGKTDGGPDMDAVLLKYNSAGVQQWVKKYDGVSDDAFTSIQLDTEENIFAAGSTNTATGDMDMLLVSYDTGGNILHSATYDHGDGGNDEAKSIVVLTDGTPILIGTVSPDTAAATLNGDIAAVGFNADGSWNWTTIFDGGLNDDASEGAYTEASGLVICGQTDNGTAAAQDYDYITLYLTADGAIDHTEMYDGTAHGSDVANTLMVLDNGAYISGGSEGEQRDIVTILYGSDPIMINNISSTLQMPVYPNPTAGVCTTDNFSWELLGDINQRIYNSAGVCVQNTTVKAGTNIQFDLTEFPAGAYTLILNDSHQTYSANIIKQ